MSNFTFNLLGHAPIIYEVMLICTLTKDCYDGKIRNHISWCGDKFQCANVFKENYKRTLYHHIMLHRLTISLDALTKGQFILNVGDGVHQGNGATRIDCSLLQEINRSASWNLSRLLSSERLVLMHTQTHIHTHSC